MTKQTETEQMEKPEVTPIFTHGSCGGAYLFKGITSEDEAKRYISEHPFLEKLKNLGLVEGFEEGIFIYSIGDLQKEGTSEKGFVFETSSQWPIWGGSTSRMTKEEMYRFVELDQNALNSGLIEKTIFNPAHSANMYSRYEGDYERVEFGAGYCWVTKPLKTSEQAEGIVKLTYETQRNFGRTRTTFDNALEGSRKKALSEVLGLKQTRKNKK